MKRSLRRRPVWRAIIVNACALGFFTVGLLADGSVCEGCACDCQGLACGFCVNYTINSCCSGPQPAGCCTATCDSGDTWEVRCEEGGETFTCQMSSLGEACVEG